MMKKPCLRKTQPFRSLASPAILFCLGILLAGCQSIGPKAMRATTQPYNESVNSVRDEQLLLNIVRLKYRDTPSFLEITSISTAYERSAGLGVEGQLRQGVNNNGLLLRPNLNMSERPTITFVPMQGDRFAKNLLTPLPVEALVYLSQSGWSAERILRVCVQRLNRVRNAPTASGPSPLEAPEYEQFQQLAAHLRALQQADGIFLTPSSDKVAGTAELVFAPEWTTSDQALAFKAALGLNPALDRFPLIPGLTQIDDRSIAISTRSLLGVLFFLSQSVEVPEEAIVAGVVTTTLHPNGQVFDWTSVYHDLFRVQRSDREPALAYQKTRYRDHWYFIADSDLHSKSTFFMLDLLFAIQSGDSRSLTPILTLPVSR
jgi:hypothetical protein